MNFILREPWIFFVCVAAALFVSTLVGFRLASATSVNEDTHRHEHISGLREGLFVLLGLLLGFTIAMVLPRFDQRRDLVAEEAHAIGTVWLRAQLLPEPQRSKSEQLLREYVDVRRSFAGETLENPTQLDRTIQQTNAIQDELWKQALQVAQQNQTAIVASYVQGLNEMIGVSEKRLAVFENRVPEAVWIIILVVAVFQSFITGYSLKRKIWLSLIVTPLVMALVMALIVDLDDPHTGLIRIQQNSMNRLASELNGQ
jgi:FtsH-binding integral membrane protein